MRSHSRTTPVAAATRAPTPAARVHDRPAAANAGPPDTSAFSTVPAATDATWDGEVSVKAARHTVTTATVGP